MRKLGKSAKNIFKELGVGLGRGGFYLNILDYSFFESAKYEVNIFLSLTGPEGV